MVSWDRMSCLRLLLKITNNCICRFLYLLTCRSHYLVIFYFVVYYLNLFWHFWWHMTVIISRPGIVNLYWTFAIAFISVLLIIFWSDGVYWRCLYLLIKCNWLLFICLYIFNLYRLLNIKTHFMAWLGICTACHCVIIFNHLLYFMLSSKDFTYTLCP